MHFHFLQTHNTALSFQHLRDEIGYEGRPVAMTWEYTDSNGHRNGRGHMMVVGGYTVNSSDSTIEIYDPLCPVVSPPVPPDPAHPCGWKIIPYSEYGSGMLPNGTEYVHWDDFYAIHRP
jgi:hypothetical protein